jgi:hypothetical protein
VLFNGLRLDGEPDGPWRTRLPVVHDDEGSWMKLPCVAFTDKCTIYDIRPSPCAGYRCELLDRMDAGEISLDDALARVAAIKLEVERVRAEMPEPTESFRTDLDAMNRRSREWKIANEAFLLRVVRLRETIARFVDRRSGLGVSDAEHAATGRR